MEHDRLKLVIPEDSGKSVTDGTTDRFDIPATPEPVMRLLRVLDADEGPLPDDAA